jgi:NAD(P)-dependent dehydrogenase (short-subunit alcohol dehydrogenase family)
MAGISPSPEHIAMNLELEGQHILITGGSKGIGLACAHRFVQEGARVSLIARQREALDAARAALTKLREDSVASTMAVDLRQPEATAEAVSAIEAANGPIAVLVNSAGAAQRTPYPELAPAKWHAAMEAKFFTYVHVMDPLIKRMGQRGAGTIVNVVGAGGKVAAPIHVAGGAANAALMLASVGLANAYAKHGVRVNVVNPGATLTDRLTEGMAADARLRGVSPEQALKEATARQPMGRIATPEEIADAVAFLASKRASYINGAVLAMDGALQPIVV